MAWWVVIPLKDTRRGKSRIAVPASVRRSITIAMLHDTVEAVLATPAVERVVVVCDDPRDVDLVRRRGVVAHVDPDPLGLNPAIMTGAALARRLRPGCHLAALPADLPGLGAAELTVALERAQQHARSFVTDAAGTGTTLLTARRGTQLDPRYGPGSARLHAATGAVELSPVGIDSLRHDVDDLDTLQAIATPGQGRTALAVLSLLPRQPTPDHGVVAVGGAAWHR